MAKYDVEYSPLENSSMESSQEKGLETDTELRRRNQARCILQLLTAAHPLITASFMLLSLSLYLGQQISSPLGTYESSFHSDFAMANVPLEIVTFTGTLHFKEDGTSYRDEPNSSAPWPANVQLFGDPGPVVDANWDRILAGRYFSISEEDAKATWGDRYLAYVDQMNGGWTAGFEALHTLHCVNALRQAIHPEYYPSQPQIHLDHCLDAIRQTIQCYGSTTLIPIRFWEGTERNYIDADQTHTCRSFAYLHDYTESRQPGKAAYVERDMSVLDPRKHALQENFMRQWREGYRESQDRE